MAKSAEKNTASQMMRMPPRPDRGVAEIEHPSRQYELGRLSWDDIRVFLACAEDASFRKAAGTLGLSSSTVSRRIERLEAALGTRLFNRTPDGIHLTREGKALLSSARDMERAIFDVLRKSGQDDEGLVGSVTISITEGLGSYWVMPQLVEFQRQHPNIAVNLSCAMESADVLRLEADMAIQFQKPLNPDLKIVKLGRLHVYPFAAPGYIERYGLPKSVDDILNHRLVLQVAPQLDNQAWARFLGMPGLENIVGIKTNASTAHFYAVEKGAGIGVLPTFASALGAPVVPIDLDGHHSMDIWLTYHPDIRKTPRKSVMVDWIRSIFDPKIYPWFREEFIHPRELAERVPDDAALNSGSGYFAATPFDL